MFGVSIDGQPLLHPCVVETTLVFGRIQQLFQVRDVVVGGMDRRESSDQTSQRDFHLRSLLLSSLRRSGYAHRPGPETFE
ncbi:hypothetical protein Z051_23635 [Rhodococcus rhodochrous KG-21]|uniref:Uncharacterized protein n=1 Tax=Rhodococcus rhodochrous KG-21 TaxID=1441923 RepID=A0A0M8PCJ4_RHORH|nr:hypothetical protein Z051_23635 [Rhodococcus rhodochrous KG-21]